jgi:CHASE2 domain-containing sensor protein
MNATPTTAAPATRRHPRIEVAIAGVLALLGIVLTSVGIFGHVATLVAPGAALIVLGGAWLGNALARADVRLIRQSAENVPG